MNLQLTHRPRRLRQSASMRNLISEVELTPAHLVAPLFLVDGEKQQIPILSMPGYSRMSLDLALQEIATICALGVKSFILFPVIESHKKNAQASEAVNENCFYLQAIKTIKQRFPDTVIMTDVALDPYSSDGHDGLVCPKTGQILNDATVEILTQMALLQARAGSDVIAPSDMMDGRVAAIRKTLEHAGFSNTLIMSYSAKYASAFYGPFREALDSAPKMGDKKSYQLDFRNITDAVKEASMDATEGADILMVKPALAYLDIIAKIKQSSSLPVAAYQVSGEYSMIKAMGKLDWGHEQALMNETLVAIKRAGADIIVTYFAKEWSQWIRQQKM